MINLLLPLITYTRNVFHWKNVMEIGKKNLHCMSPWITKGLLKSINKKNKLYKQYLNSPSKELLQKFKTYKNKLNMLIRKSKRSHFYTKFELAKNDMKKTWKTINNVIGKGQKQSLHSNYIGWVWQCVYRPTRYFE